MEEVIPEKVLETRTCINIFFPCGMRGKRGLGNNPF
jgi:hypothetical protein